MSALGTDDGAAGGPASKQAPQKTSLCQVCGKNESKYCCPRCDKKTCSLDCVKEHKEANRCSGKRDRTAFLGRGQLDESSLLSDYRFLEDVQRADDVAKRAKPPAPRAELPGYLQSLVHQARRRGVQLFLLAPGMERRRTNTTRYDKKHQLVSWRVEWSFLAAGCKTANAKVSEEAALKDVLAAHLTTPPGASLKTPELQRYADEGIDKLHVVMRKEKTPANTPLYYRIDFEKRLRMVLAGKAIVEFPVFLVLLPEEVDEYTIVEEKEDAGAGIQQVEAAKEEEEPAEGGFAGMAGVLAGAPLDLVRIRQQQPGGASLAPHRGILSILKDAMRTEGGFRAIFKGLAYPLSTAALQNAVCFNAYAVACRHLTSSNTSQYSTSENTLPHRQEGQVISPEPPIHGARATPPVLSFRQVFWAGCFAGLVQTPIVNPVDLLKIRLQLQTAAAGSPGYIGPLHMLQKVLTSEGSFLRGIRSLYRGSTITLIRDVPSHGVYFVTFEAARERLEPGCRSHGRKSESALAVLAAGGIAGCLSWFVVYPFDVIKSRIQATPAETSRYKGWIDCALQSWQREGFLVFFKGLNATLARAFLVNGAIFTAYEAAHSVIKGT